MVTVLLGGSALFLMAASPFLADSDKKVDGKVVFEQKCLKCHKVDKFSKIRNDRRGWETVLRRMERNSCILSDAETNAVADYLSKQYGE